MKKAALFILTVIIIVSSINYVSNIIKYKQLSTYSKGIFYKENIDYDVIFMGTSSIHYAISPLYLFNKYGLSSYNLSVPGCTYSDLYALTEEAINEKNTKVYIVEYQTLLSTNKNLAFVKGNISSINNGYLRFKAYAKDNDFTNAFQDANLYYLFHNRWKYIKEEDFYTLNFLRGYYSSPIKSKPIFTSADKPYILSDAQKQQIDEYINLLNKYDKRLILIATPHTNHNTLLSDNAVKSVKDYVSKYNIEFINLRDLDIYDINNDFQSSLHINYQGGKKLMDRNDFIPYIMKKYNLQDHRNDKKFAQWHKDYLKQERMINGEELKYSKDFNEWWNYANYDNYTIISSVNGDNVTSRLPQEIKDKFASKGLNKFETNQEKMNYAFIINNNQVYFESASQSNVMFKERIENNLNLTLYSAGNAGIMISGKYKGKNKYGLNFVVYDKVTREVVDSIWVAPEDFNKINR